MVEHDVEEAFQKTLDEIDALREQGRYEGDPYIEEEENGVKVKKPNPNRKKRQAGLINEVLWTCGGLDKALLRMCPTDWAKKAGMGGTILGTAVLATFSGGYAAYTVFESFLIAAITGFIWGLVIFNLDRYLVNSMYSDGEPTISKQEFLSGLPRIIIAIFLGIVISTPIELKIFEGEINQQINAENSQKIKSNEEGDKDIVGLEQDLNAQREILSLMQTKYQEYQDKYNDEVFKGAAGRIKGEGPVALALKADRDKYFDTTLKPQQDKVNGIENSLRDLKLNRRTITVDNNKKEQGLSKRIEMLFKATSFYVNKLDDSGKVVLKKDDKGNATGEAVMEFNSLWLVRILISLMFIILEILPVVNKMMQTDGEYDRLIDLESDTRKKLTRIKEFNNILVLIGGNLSPFTNQTLYGKLPDDKNPGLVFEDHEGNKAFAKSDFRKENKNETDSDNHDIYKHAREVCKKYVMTKIDKLFEGTYSKDIDEDFSSSQPQTSGTQPMSSNIDTDPSDDVIKI